MLVLRLETAEGHGVFTTGIVYSVVDMVQQQLDERVYHHPADCPSPNTDAGLGYIDRHEYCGFESFEQYRRWFSRPEMDEALDKCGVYMSTYDVPDDAVRRGSYQVVFVRDRAKKVDRQPCVAFR